MFGIGDTEFVLIVIFAFLLFGPDKLPGMAVPASAEEPEAEAAPASEPGANPRSAASLYGLAPKAPAADPSTAAPEDPAPAGAADPAAGEEGGSRA